MHADTIRLRVFKGTGNGHKLLLKVSAHHVRQEFFYEFLGNIQQMC